MAVTDARACGAVLLDKDGTLLENVPYNVDPARMRLARGAARALATFGELGMPIAVVSNQPGVALGRFPETALGAARHRLAELFAQQGAMLAGFFYCPHHPAGTVVRYACDCACRKPQPGLLFRAAAQLGVSLDASWMIGDILDDVEAGRAAGCRTILVDCGNETEWRYGGLRTPDFIASRLDDAAWIVARECAATAAAPAAPGEAPQEGRR
ncbi:D-glycero-alpha-D-manno-heptose-1,7-bisphosphate 7-phosphatase [Burkholderia pseudomallei]|uniref:D-glycero-alpha-D-manno-heptose-1,7-bisphosphate 7-phosphatase n=1 Tax=Burkholderia pseudomallei TaxID=28450 RepID=UPI0005389220|nr:HAD-IIIA family hydrolase [Burkholderia pseudomallei]KGW62253.1 HAD hydrolase, IA, variant 1 family protein [Burkholderia pseudomallei MSHR1029]